MLSGVTLLAVVTATLPQTREPQDVEKSGRSPGRLPNRMKRSSGLNRTDRKAIEGG
jgi:hypothetical protein